MSPLEITIKLDFGPAIEQLRKLVSNEIAMDDPQSIMVGPRYLPGQLVMVRGAHLVVTSIRPPNSDGVRLYDLLTLEGSRHIYTDVPECELKPDRPLTSSAPKEDD